MHGLQLGTSPCPPDSSLTGGEGRQRGPLKYRAQGRSPSCPGRAGDGAGGGFRFSVLLFPSEISTQSQNL